jgi:hypothetical protein
MRDSTPITDPSAPRPSGSPTTESAKATLPPELRQLPRPRPRSVPRARQPANLAISALLTLLFGTCTALFSGLVVFEWRGNDLIRNTGIVAAATITDLDVSGKSKNVSHHMAYEFRTATGIVVSKRISIPEAEYRFRRVGEIIFVVYAPSDPRIHHPDDGRDPEAILVEELTGALLLGACLFLSALSLRNTIRSVRFGKQLDTEGLATTGTVIDLWTGKARTRSGPEIVQYIAYAFRATGPDGGRWAVRAEINPSAFAALSIGDRVAVEYLRDNPETCRLADFEGKTFLAWRGA